MLSILCALLACDANIPPEEAAAAPPVPPPSGIAARIAAASCGMPAHADGTLDGAFYAASLDVLGGMVTTNTWSAASGVPSVTTPLADDLRCEPSVALPSGDMPLDAVLAAAWPCAQALGSVGGNPLKNVPRVDWHVERPEWVTVSFPEEAPRTMPSGRDVVVELRTGACHATVMD